MAEPIFHELAYPDDAKNHDESIEVLRAWVIDKHLQCSINVAVFSDHTQWGVFLSDLAHHIATGLNQVHGVDGRETLKAIVTRFQNEMFEQDAARDAETVS